MALQLNKKTGKKNKENSALVEEIRNVHTELTLCGEPRNALLRLPNDLLSYISSLLRDESPRLPNVSMNQWSDLLSHLIQHGILPLLYWKICSMLQEFRPPEDIISQLKKAFLLNSMSYLQIKRQLGEIVRPFQSEGVRLLVLKGPALGWSIYPDPAMRPSCDLDLLVLPDQIAQARAILVRLGYKCLGKRFKHCKDFYCEESFIPQNYARNNRPVELHWDLHSFSGISRDVRIEDLFLRAVKVESSDLTFETLHPVDALIHRAINMALYHNRVIRLIWIYDMALLARQLVVPDDWKVLQERSVAWRARLALENSLKMAQVWVGLKLPDRFSEFSSWPRPTETEVAAWSDALLRHNRITSFFRLHWSNSSEPLEKTRFLFHLLFPNPKIIRIRYPPSHKWLIPLSYVRRWHRWLRQYFGNRNNSLKQKE
jgi:hypothetical protein